MSWPFSREDRCTSGKATAMMGTKARLADADRCGLAGAPGASDAFLSSPPIASWICPMSRDLVTKTYAPGGRASVDPAVFWHRCNE